MDDAAERFGGVARLVGRDGLRRLTAARVAVIGLGGVGSWAAEALARSGVGKLLLVDLDDVCVTNVNRQLPAQQDTIGRPKVEVMAGRLRAINPVADIQPVMDFFTAATADTLLAPPLDYVVDAIDSPSLKVLLAAGCRERGVPVMLSGGAGGRRDPTQIRVADLADSTHDGLLAQVRRCLRREHGFPPAGGPIGGGMRFHARAAGVSRPGWRGVRHPRGGGRFAPGLSRRLGHGLFRDRRVWLRPGRPGGATAGGWLSASGAQLPSP